VRPILFRKYLREANAAGSKNSTRRVLTKDNCEVQPGTFEGVFFETGRARLNKPRAELRAQCRFESGRVRVVSIFPDVRVGDLFYVKNGRYGSRKASEQTLEVVRVRVARLQDMTEAEALDEGVRMLPGKFQRGTARDTFAALWDDLGGSWAANPWVWIYIYRTHDTNVDTLLKGDRR
jgi:hypothetical protein